MTDRAQWLQDRRSGVGASDVAGIVGRSRWDSPWSIWADKVGITAADDDQSELQRFGLELEPIIAARFHEATGLYVAGEQMVIRRPGTPWFATVDGVVVEGAEPFSLEDALGIFEAKYNTTEAAWEQLPDYYVIQVQWAMYCASLPVAWVAALHAPFGRPMPIEIHEVEADPQLAADLVDKVERFWEEHVLTGKPPPVDAHQATTAALAEAYPDPERDEIDLLAYSTVVEELRNLKVERKAVDNAIAEAENVLRAALGEHTEGAINGRLVASWRPQNRTVVDAARVRAEHGDTYDSTTTSRVLRLHGGD